jgi:ABC-type sugar transport system ATPase subunit
MAVPLSSPPRRGRRADGPIPIVTSVRHLQKVLRREDGSHATRRSTGVSLDGRAASSSVLLGPSGVRSRRPLLRSLAGLEEPESGTIAIRGGRRVFAAGPRRRTSPAGAAAALD